MKKEWTKARFLGWQNAGYDANGNTHHIIALAFGNERPAAEVFYVKGALNAKVFNLRPKDLFMKDVWVVIKSASKASQLYMNEITDISLENK